jgi:hypothetical protein
MHTQRAARSFVRGLEIRLKAGAVLEKNETKNRQEKNEKPVFNQ